MAFITRQCVGIGGWGLLQQGGGSRAGALADRAKTESWVWRMGCSQGGCRRSQDSSMFPDHITSVTQTSSGAERREGLQCGSPRWGATRVEGGMEREGVCPDIGY